MDDDGTTATGAAGSILLRGSEIWIAGSTIDTSTKLSGRGGGPGSVNINSRGGVTASETQINTVSRTSFNNSGNVTIVGASFVSLNGVRISSYSYDDAFASVGGSILVSSVGTVSVLGQSRLGSAAAGFSAQNAGAIMLLGRDVVIADSDLTTINDSPGMPGSITLRAEQGTVSLRNAQILSDSAGISDSGVIEVDADYFALDKDSKISVSVRGGPQSNRIRGGIGSLSLHAAREINVEGVIEAKYFASSDHPELIFPGEVRLSTPRLNLGTSALISTETLGNVPASSIIIEAPLSSDGRFVPLIILGDGSGIVTSSTTGAGAAGAISVHPGQLVLAGVTLLSQTHPGSIGRAGTVTLEADREMSIINSRISTDTSGAGDAGNVNITARNLFIDPSTISSTSVGAGGNAGSVSVAADSINIDASRITSAALGTAAAGAVNVNFGSLLALRNNSAITTTAENGNGGPITINGGRVMFLNNSQVSTSVGGLTGNGGNINVNADALILKTGFIQANTEAANAAGGNVTINVNTLIPSASTLFLGGAMPITFQPGVLGLNVIQAAAPDGVAGAIEVTSPQLDLSGSLSNLAAAIVDTSALSRDLCRIGAGSSLTPIGRGGLAPYATDALRPESPPPASALGVGRVSYETSNVSLGALISWDCLSRRSDRLGRDFLGNS